MKHNRIVALLLLLILIIIPGCGIEKMLSDAEGHLEAEKYEEAITLYEKILDEDKKNVDAYSGIIKAYCAINEMESALKYYDKATEKLPENDFSIVRRVFNKALQEKENATLSALDLLHTAILCASMDPEIVNGSDWTTSKQRFESTVDISTIKPEDGAMEKEILEILKAESGKDYVTRNIFISDETHPVVYGKITNNNKVSVWIDGYELEYSVD